MHDLAKYLIIGCMLSLGCKSPEKKYLPAENGLDAGREFIDACNKGDFSKAAFYMIPDEKNLKLLNEEEAAYRDNDKEGRQQLRTASINIKSVTEPTDSTVILQYSNSTDTIGKTLYMIRRDQHWLVNYQQSIK